MAKTKNKPLVVLEEINEDDITKGKEIVILVIVDGIEAGYIVKNTSDTYFDLLDTPTIAFTLDEMGEVFSKMKEISKIKSKRSRK